MIKPAREIDALVAEKVMGWSDFHRHEDTWFGHRPDADKLHPYREPPHYSTDIAAALDVIETLRSMRPEAICLSVHASPGGNYKVECRLEVRGSSGNWYSKIIYSAVEDTAPLAICVAALGVLEELND